MAGTITRWDAIAHPVIVVQGFGWRVFACAVFGRCPTFLACVARSWR